MAAVISPPSSAWTTHPHQHSYHHQQQQQTTTTRQHLDEVSQQPQQQYPPPNTTPSPVHFGHSQDSHHSHSLKLKPYLRKLSLRDQAGLDLSRPAAENQSFTGLGFYDASGSGSDIAFSPTSNSRSNHKRTTSNISTLSSSSAHLRTTSPSFPQPLRHTPRPYTPPITRSHTASSLLDSDNSAEADDIMSDEDFRSRQRGLDHSRRSGSIGSLPTAPYMAHMQSTGSLTRLNQANPSQSSLPSLPTSRPRGDTMRSDVTHPSSGRTSIDKARSYLRSAAVKEEPIDAATRAQHIMAARIAFAEKEEAKERKAEKEMLRQQNRANKKRQQKEEREHNRRRSESNGTSAGSEKMAFAYTEFTPSHKSSLPLHQPTAPATTTTTHHRSERHRRGSGAKSFKNKWLGFLAWFRTRLLRISKKMGTKS